MPLSPAAIPAVQDTNRGIVRFVMSDGAKRVNVVVSLAALDDLDDVAPYECSYVHRFKEHRQRFEVIASDKYDRGYVEIDGTICIKSADVPFLFAD